MLNSQLNLARSWRSRNFDEIIGQSLIVSILKNSLYKNIFFPAYLFSGSHGCGKTTTARIFAASVNCEQLSNFQKNPRVSIPCRECISCTEFFAGRHPDFIEIDGASHTSVDNVRVIIESASFLPVLGNKKVYLIDEAHMLSKSAFNAFLKILEEPPYGVMFILATTDPDKIIDTVLSRCFQLFFKPVDKIIIANHLRAICDAENLVFELDALNLLACQSEGSVRDAINLLERVRFAESAINKKTVIKILGFIDDESIVEILNLIVQGNSTELLNLLSKIDLEQFNALAIWKKWINILTTAIWLKIGQERRSAIYNTEKLKLIINNISLDKLNNYREICYQHELQFIRTRAQHELLETLFLHLCFKNSENLIKKNSFKIENNLDNLDQQDKQNKLDELNKINGVVAVNQDLKWAEFLERIIKLDNQLVISIFKQARFIEFNAQDNSVLLAFSSSMSFFEIWLTDTKLMWQPILDEIYNCFVIIKTQFIADADTKIKEIKESQKPNLDIIKKEDKNNKVELQQVKLSKPELNLLSDRVKSILEVFPGTVTILREGEHE